MSGRGKGGRGLGKVSAGKSGSAVATPGTTKRRRKTEPNYNIYISRVMKRLRDDENGNKDVVGVTTRGLDVMSSLLSHLEGRLKRTAIRVAKMEKKATMSKPHIEVATKLIFPMELEKGALEMANIALDHFDGKEVAA
jgi:histone H2B